jgi:hypothetical protein
MAVIKVKTQKVSGGGGIGAALKGAGSVLSSAMKKKKCKDGKTASEHGGKCPENKSLNELDSDEQS